MGRYKNRGSKASYKKKHDQKFREKEYQLQRDIVKGNVDSESYAYTELGTVANPENHSDISERILKAGPPGFLSTTKHAIGSMMVESGTDSVPLGFNEVADLEGTLKDIQDSQKIGIAEGTSPISEIVEIQESVSVDLSNQVANPEIPSDKSRDSRQEKSKNVSKDTNRERGNIEMFVSQRVKRGMVFWYNIHPSVDKNSSPTIEVEGKKYLDSLEYGNRPWLVVSGEEINRKSRICTIVPLSSSQSNYNDNSPNKVHIYFCGRDTTILCEQMRTVNSIELREYASTLSDEVMDLVDKGIMYAMGIKSEITLDSITMSDALSKIDSVVNSVIQVRLKKELENLNKGRQEAIDDMILRISDGFESLYQSAIDGVRDDMQKRDFKKKSSDSVELEIEQVPTEQESLSKSQEDLLQSISKDKPFTSYSTRVAKFYERYPEAVLEAGEGKDTGKEENAVERNSEAPRAIPRKTHMFDNVFFTDSYKTINPPPKKGAKRQWTDELLAQFAYDFKYLPYSDIMARWDIGDEKKVIDMARKIERKIFTGNMNGKTDFSTLKITYPGGVISYV